MKQDYRKALVGVGIDCGNEWTEASKDLLLLRTWVQGENDSGVEQWIAVVFHVLCLSDLFHTLGGSGVEAKESGVGRSRSCRSWCCRSRSRPSEATCERHLRVCVCLYVWVFLFVCLQVYSIW